MGFGGYQFEKNSEMTSLTSPYGEKEVKLTPLSRANAVDLFDLLLKIFFTRVSRNYRKNPFL